MVVRSSCCCGPQDPGLLADSTPLVSPMSPLVSSMLFVSSVASVVPGPAAAQAFKTPDIIRLFARKQPAVLRRRLGEVEREGALGRLDAALVVQQKLEILGALAKLGEQLDPAELAFFEAESDSSLRQFSAVSETVVIKEGLGLTK